jgi:PAS domain S-box-containing protein
MTSDAPPTDEELKREALERSAGELERANRRLLLLNEVATSLILGEASRDRLTQAFAAVAREVDARFYFHYRVDDDEPAVMTLQAAVGLDEPQLSELQRIRIGGSYLSGRIAQNRTALVLDNVDRRAELAATFIHRMGVRAYAGFPLLAHGELFGTVAFASTTQAAFAPADVALLKMVTDQFSAALERMRLVERLRDSETRYRGAVITGRIAAWETDMVRRRRVWTEEGMALFGLDLPDGIGQVGGEDDEFQRSLHPDDRHMMAQFHRTADEQDDYPCEYRIVRPDGSTLWVSGRGRVIARGADGRAERVANIVVDVTERKNAEERVQLVMREMTHRSKNLLSVVQALAARTARSAGTLEEFERRYTQRLRGLAASHDLLLQRSWRGAPLTDLARKQLAPFVEIGSARLSLSGPDVILTSEATQAVGLALHELATNATKYGAWSAPSGSVALGWDFDDIGAARRLRLSWIERGGPRVQPPERKGFGHFLLESMAARSVNGEVLTEFGATGLSWTLSMPVNNLVA